MHKLKDIFKSYKTSTLTMPFLFNPFVKELGGNMSEALLNEDMQAKAMINCANIYNSLACVSMMNLSLEANAFGANLNFFDKTKPNIDKAKVIDSYEKAISLKIPNLDSLAVSSVINAINKVDLAVKNKPVFACVSGPFTVVSMLMGMNSAISATTTNDKTIKVLLEKVSEFLITYIRKLKQSKASGIIVAEPVASLLRCKSMRQFSSDYISEIFKNFDDTNLIKIYHNCGNISVDYIDSILASNADCYHFGNSVDMCQILKNIQDKIVMGNIDCVNCFCSQNAEYTKKATFKLLENCSKFDNFIISSACEIPFEAKFENIDAFFATVDKFYK